MSAEALAVLAGLDHLVSLPENRALASGGVIVASDPAGDEVLEAKYLTKYGEQGALRLRPEKSPTLYSDVERGVRARGWTVAPDAPYPCVDDACWPVWPPGTLRLRWWRGMTVSPPASGFAVDVNVDERKGWYGVRVDDSGSASHVVEGTGHAFHGHGYSPRLYRDMDEVRR